MKPDVKPLIKISFAKRDKQAMRAPFPLKAGMSAGIKRGLAKGLLGVSTA